jgi:hypothetical protein
MEPTRGRYLPGVGKTITRANIADRQAERAKAGDLPLTAEQIAEEFCLRGMAKRRHVHRAETLLAAM